MFWGEVNGKWQCPSLVFGTGIAARQARDASSGERRQSRVTGRRAPVKTEARFRFGWRTLTISEARFRFGSTWNLRWSPAIAVRAIRTRSVSEGFGRASLTLRVSGAPAPQCQDTTEHPGPLKTEARFRFGWCPLTISEARFRFVSFRKHAPGSGIAGTETRFRFDRRGRSLACRPPTAVVPAERRIDVQVPLEL